VSVVECAYGSDYARAVGADHAGLVLRLEHVGDADHVCGGQLTPPMKLPPQLCIPCCGIPSVILAIVSFCVLQVDMHTYVTIRPISAAIASSILFAATGGLYHGQSV
jgi:hypothetical protein